MSATIRTVRLKSNYDSIAWKWMRYSGILLIPLAWGHVLIQDVLVGVHKIDLAYVAMRWSFWGWRVYDFLLLAFAFAHGINGLRQILFDHVQNKKAQPYAFLAAVGNLGCGLIDRCNCNYWRRTYSWTVDQNKLFPDR